MPEETSPHGVRLGDAKKHLHSHIAMCSWAGADLGRAVKLAVSIRDTFHNDNAKKGIDVVPSN